MARKLLHLVFLISVLSCCKGDPPIDKEYSLPVGTWSIVEVDSGSIPNVPNPSFQFRESMGLTGELIFNDGGRGSLYGDVELISCKFNDFTWVYNDSLSCIYLIFNDRLSKGLIQKMNQDSIVFDFQDWCRGGDRITGAAVYYRITALK